MVPGCPLYRCSTVMYKAQLRKADQPHWTLVLSTQLTFAGLDVHSLVGERDVEGVGAAICLECALLVVSVYNRQR